jgi:hypothetical protein
MRLQQQHTSHTTTTCKLLLPVDARSLRAWQGKQGDCCPAPWAATIRSTSSKAGPQQQQPQEQATIVTTVRSMTTMTIWMTLTLIVMFGDTAAAVLLLPISAHIPLALPHHQQQASSSHQQHASLPLSPLLADLFCLYCWRFWQRKGAAAAALKAVCWL